MGMNRKIKTDNLNSTFSNYLPMEMKHLQDCCDTLQEYLESPELILYNFPRFMRKQEITKFLVMHELFKLIIDQHGSIVEVGVLDGFNVFSLAHFSEIYEHRNYTRKIIGCDTFGKYSSISKTKDQPDFDLNMPSCASYEKLKESVDGYNRSIEFSQFEKIELVKGDICTTGPIYKEQHPELVVAMLLCQTGMYKPTKASLEIFYPLMPQGSIIVFGTLNYAPTPGELRALDEVIGLDQIRLKRFPFATKTSYFIKGQSESCRA